MTRLDDYLDLIDRERYSRPAEAMLADEIRRLRLALEKVADTDCHDPYCAAVQRAEAALKASYSDIVPSDDGESLEPGPCGDPECPVLHADPANPIHPPSYKDSRSCDPETQR